MLAPHDYVSNPVPSVPIHASGRATFDELIEVFADRRRVPLVGSDDPDGGPYTHCVRVDVHDVEIQCRRGYRTLTAEEFAAVLIMPDDFGDATD